MSPTAGARREGVGPAAWILGAGVVAALHVGKLSAALPVLRQELDLTLVQAGFLVSLVQLAGMMLGLFTGVAADTVGLRRSMLTGLLLLGGASFCGAWAQGAEVLMWLRAVEGLGFLLTVMPAPALIRQHVSMHRLSTMLGFWGAYMPLGTAMALLLGPWLMVQAGWQGWWQGMAALSCWMAFMLWRKLPVTARPERPRTREQSSAATASWAARLGRTLRSGGAWLVALSFGMYSAQWLAIIGFLPTIYDQAGWAGGATAVMTALVAAVNMVGNIGAGKLLQKGARPTALMYIGFAVMALAAALAFGQWHLPGFAGEQAWGRYLAVLCFSAVGGVIPGTLFSLAVRHAPSEDTVSTTVGWMQQWSALGQFAGPPLVAWMAAWKGGWQWTWMVTGAFALMGMGLTWLLAQRSRA